MKQRRLLLLTTGFALAAVLGAVQGTWATFADATLSDGNAITASSELRAPSGTRSTLLWDVNDRSSGTASNQDALLAFTDAPAVTTQYTLNLPIGATDTTKWVEADFSPGPLPGTLDVTGAQIRFRMATYTATQTICFHVETRLASTGALLASHGDNTTPTGCVTGTAFQDFTIPAPEVDTTAEANDLAVRIIARASSATTPNASIDRLTVTGGTSLQSFELFPRLWRDRTSGGTNAPVDTLWTLAADDGAMFETNSWSQTAAPATRYIEYGVPSIVPAGAAITNTTFRHSWRANSGGPAGNVCFYYQAWSGGVQVGGNVAGGCNNSKSVTHTDTVTLPALTAAQAADLKVRAVGTSSNNRASQIDRADLSVTYSRW